MMKRGLWLKLWVTLIFMTILKVGKLKKVSKWLTEGLIILKLVLWEIYMIFQHKITPCFKIPSSTFPYPDDIIWHNCHNNDDITRRQFYMLLISSHKVNLTWNNSFFRGCRSRGFLGGPRVDFIVGLQLLLLLLLLSEPEK